MGTYAACAKGPLLSGLRTAVVRANSTRLQEVRTSCTVRPLRAAVILLLVQLLLQLSLRQIIFRHLAYYFQSCRTHDLYQIINVCFFVMKKVMSFWLILGRGFVFLFVLLSFSPFHRFESISHRFISFYPLLLIIFFFFSLEFLTHVISFFPEKKKWSSPTSREKKKSGKKKTFFYPNEPTTAPVQRCRSPRKRTWLWNKKFTKNIITLEKSYSRDFNTTPRPENRPSDGMEMHAVEEI